MSIDLWLPHSIQPNGHSTGQGSHDVEFLLERLAELEMAIDAEGWQRLSGESDYEFSRERLADIIRMARLMFLKNPLIRRAIRLQAYYVWGQGWNVKAAHEAVNAVVQRFLDDPKNTRSLTSHQARVQREIDLQHDGNLFLALFTNRINGVVRVRTIPVDEIQTIICNPEDRDDPWFYKRAWTATVVNMQTGNEESKAQTAYYPDWRHRPTMRRKTIGQHPILWDVPVYHVAVGGLSTMRFGVPEVYPALDWARAYKEYLEDWATIMRALSRFAMKLTTRGGKSGVASAKAKLGTTYGPGRETNPPPNVGSMFIAAEGQDLQPIKTAGVTTDAESGRPLRLMVGTAVGLPDTFLSGDGDIGSLATAKSLDRPTELQMSDRRTLWTNVFMDLFTYAVDQAALAPGYTDLSGSRVLDPNTGETVVQLRGDIDRAIEITYPPILEHDEGMVIESIVRAATLDGKTLAGTMDIKTVAEMLFNALGRDDVDELISELFPGDGRGDLQPPKFASEQPDTMPGFRGSGQDTAQQVDERLLEAIRELKVAVDYAGAE